MSQVVYRAAPTMGRFHQSNAFYRFVIGPVGSGKSSGMCAEIMRRANEQIPSPIDGKRKSRWVVVRNTYRELADSSIRTWLDWFAAAGRYNKNDSEIICRYDDIECDVLFRALDRPDDVKKLLSVEYTGAWVNEAREIPKSVIDVLGDRVGRYPSMRDGGCTWAGVMGDTNPPDDDHWLYVLAEEERPENWEFFKQPGGLIEVDGKFYPNPAAENVANLPVDYYVTRMTGKNLNHIRVYYCSRYGFVKEGRPVIPEYVDETHCAKEILPPVKGLPIRVGIDWGLTPAAVYTQRLANGRWLWLRETVTEHMGAKNFGALLAREVADHFAGFQFETMYGDPAGEASAQTDEQTVFQVFNEALRVAKSSLVARPAPSNDPVLRHGALGAAMGRIIDGKPGFLISPACRVTRKGLAGGYCYKRLLVAGDERYQDKPDKNRYSHPVEAGEYAMIGAGEGVNLVRGVPRDPNPQTVMEFNVYRYENEATAQINRETISEFNAFTGE